MTTMMTQDIPSIADHPDVRECETRRADLKARTADVGARVADLRAERERVVTTLTSDPSLTFPARSQAEAHLATLETELPRLERELQALHEASERERQIGVQIRRQAEIERQQAARVAACEAARRMLPIVQQLLNANRAYMALRTAAGNQGCPYPIFPEALEAWARQEGVR